MTSSNRIWSNLESRESFWLQCIRSEFIIGFKFKIEYSLQKLCWLKTSLGHTYRGRVDMSYQTTLLHKIKYRDSANEVPGDNQGWHILVCRSEFASLVWYGKPMPCSQHLHIQFIILWETKACWGAFASPHPSLGEVAGLLSEVPSHHN